MATHHLDAQPGTVTDVFSRDLAPVLTVDPGDRVVVHSLDAHGHLERQQFPGEIRPAMFSEWRGHCLCGPIAVRGARPGMALAVRFADLRPDPWGWTTAGNRDNLLNRQLDVSAVKSSLLWEIDGRAGVATSSSGPRVRLAPFLGVVGMPPDEPGEHSTIPPRTAGGGNIDCRSLVAGSVLYLPVTVPDALLCVGDGHAAQGDGEVGGTAIECGMTTEMDLDLVADVPVNSIHATTPSGRITFGFSDNLNEAAIAALDAMLAWMQLLLGLEKVEALALASVVVDLRVTQVANQVWGVHAVLPDDALL
ncbi:MAG TPA: acetamidase/formamidase family protein [Streptosporangiaceae bacterium]